MKTQSTLVRNSLKHAAGDLRVWVGQNAAKSAISFAGAFCGLPVYLLLRGISLEVLTGELIKIAAYSIAGPFALVIVAYLYFLSRAPGNLYAERTSELCELRRKLGMPTGDLEVPQDAEAHGSISKYFTKIYLLTNGGMVVAFAILLVSYGILADSFLKQRDMLNWTRQIIDRNILQVDLIMQNRQKFVTALATICKRESAAHYPECKLLDTIPRARKEPK